jgi:DNA polymerase III subunit epsilon
MNMSTRNANSEFVSMIQGDDYLVLDTETTGLHDGEIVQIAIINQSGDVLLDTFVKPVYTIPADATRIHGITDAMVKDAPGWADVLPVVYTLLNGKHVVIYNAVYDRKMMHQSSEKAGVP